MQTIEDSFELSASEATAKIRIHPLIYGQLHRLPSIETQVVVDLVYYEKFHHRRSLQQALRWTEKILELYYGDSSKLDFSFLLGEPPTLERLSGTADMFCTGNGLSDDAFTIVSAMTIHRSDGVDGRKIIQGAVEALERMLAETSTGLATEKQPT